MTSKHYTATTNTSASAETSWKMLTNISQWKTWDKDIIDVQYTGDLKQKGSGNLITPYGQMHEFKIVSFSDGATYTMKYKLSSGILFVKRTVVSEGNGAAITQEVWFKGISSKTFQKYYGTDYETKLQNKLKDLKTLLEG